VGRKQIGRAYPLGGEGADDAVRDERRISHVVDMLELATAAAAEMTAWRHGAVRSRLDTPIRPQQIARRGERSVPAIGGDAVAARRDADDRSGFHHRQAATALGR
jgi:hypothetical protein